MASLANADPKAKELAVVANGTRYVYQSAIVGTSARNGGFFPARIP